MNICAINGNLVRDGETKFEKEGKGLNCFTLAVNDHKRINGKYVKMTSFLDCQYYASLKLQAKLIKGELVSVTGAIKQERWKDKDSGETRAKIVIDCNKVECHQKRVDNGEHHENFDPLATPLDSPGQYDTPGDDPYPPSNGSDGSYSGPDYY